MSKIEAIVISLLVIINMINFRKSDKLSNQSKIFLGGTIMVGLYILLDVQF